MESIFGVDVSYKESPIVLLPLTLDITSSGEKGIWSLEDLVDTSLKVDFIEEPKYWVDDTLIRNCNSLNIIYRDKVQEYQEWYLENAEIIDGIEVLDWKNCSKQYQANEYKVLVEEVNRDLTKLHQSIQDRCTHHYSKDKKVIVLGGEHSVALGNINAAKQHEPSLLHLVSFDAHLDLRKSYQHFKHSHASVFYNAIEENNLTSIHLGVRDISREEINYLKDRQGNQFFTDIEMLSLQNRGIYHGESNFYLSIDVDVLQPQFCPSTGTPFPGGLDFRELLLHLRKRYLQNNKDKCVGLDICEIGYTKMDYLTVNKILVELWKLLAF